jgi:uncharacterized protein
MNNLLSAFIESSCFSFALLAIAIIRQSYNSLVASYYCFTAIIFYYLFAFLPKLSDFNHFTWNWEGKFAEIFWSFFLIYLLKWVDPIEVGLKFPNVKDMVLGISIGLIYTILALIKMTLMNDFFNNDVLNIETIIYQLTMPGIAEELFYRGVLLAILNHYFDRKWQFFGAMWGIGSVLITLLFILDHILFYAPFGINIANLSFDLIFLSLSLIYLREKTGSIWPGIFCHNIANSLKILYGWL